MQSITPRFHALLMGALALVAGALSACAGEPTVLRIGYFPNVTHAQGLIGAQSTRDGTGWFEQ